MYMYIIRTTVGFKAFSNGGRGFNGGRPEHDCFQFNRKNRHHMTIVDKISILSQCSIEKQELTMELKGFHVNRYQLIWPIPKKFNTCHRTMNIVTLNCV